MSYETITTVCPYCGTGCLIDCTVDRENNRVIEAKGSPHGVNNDGRLCLKGLYGWDYLNDPKILTKRIRTPLIRRGGKGAPLGRSHSVHCRSLKGYHQRIRPRHGYGCRLGSRSRK